MAALTKIPATGTRDAPLGYDREARRFAVRGTGMSYVKKAIQPNERILHEAKLHWMIYSTALGILTLGLCFGAWTATMPPNPVTPWAFLAIMAGAGVAALDAWITRFSTEIVVTDKRLIHKTGFIRYVSTEKTLDRIDSVDVSQSILGRMLGFGTILIRGTGTTIEVISDVDDPLAFRTAIMNRSAIAKAAPPEARTA